MLLLDTDVMVDIMRGYDPALDWLETVPEDTIALPGFVIMELVQGCDNKEEQKLLLRETDQYRTIWPVPETCHRALKVFADVHLGHGTGLLDALIGQIAIDLNVPLHSFNEKHYAPIPDLEVNPPYDREE
ncbi:MAG: PIN domain-containing protein [Salinibacter sp.]